MTEPIATEPVGSPPGSASPEATLAPPSRITPFSSPVSGPVGRDLVTVLGGMLLLGIVCGVLWWLLSSPAEFTKTRDGGVMSEVDLGRRFSTDALYVVIALVAGLAAGLGLAWWRGRDPFLTSILLVLGSVLAAAVMALVGHALGPDDTREALRAARIGARVPETMHVDVWTVYLAWPVAVLAGALTVLLGAPADADS
jgi:hypothetical protein